jgi:hypothetical protein
MPDHTNTDARRTIDADTRSLGTMLTILVIASVAFLSQALPYVA